MIVITFPMTAIRNSISGASPITYSSITGVIGLNQGAVDHNSLGNLAVGDPHTQYPILSGRVGGQLLVGGTGVTDTLKLQGTSGNGTVISPAIQMLVGNNGATVAVTVLNNSNVGIGTTSPNAKNEILSTTEQLRLSYDATHYGSFTTAANGDVTFGGTTGKFISGSFVGPLTGNVTGDASGSSGSCLGNAATVSNGVYTNVANSMSLINPLTTIAESWIGPSSTTGVYFKGGNVALGTTSGWARFQINSAAPYIAMYDTNAYNASPISTILLGGKYTAGGDLAGFAYIKAGKSNSINGNYASYLGFWTATTGAPDLTERIHIDNLGNIGISTSTFGTNATGVLGITNSTAPTTAPADMIQIYSSDGVSGTVLSVFQEYAPYAGVGVASTHKIPVIFNGTAYYILATTIQ